MVWNKKELKNIDTAVKELKENGGVILVRAKGQGLSILVDGINSIEACGSLYLAAQKVAEVDKEN